MFEVKAMEKTENAIRLFLSSQYVGGLINYNRDLNQILHLMGSLNSGCGLMNT